MQEKFLFEYAVIRVMPRVEREEFLNVGLILFCSRKKYLQSIYFLDEPRLKAFCLELDIEELKANLDAFVRISTGDKGSGPIGQYDAASRFRWLTATRSTVIQCSKVHPGFCENPAETLLRLYQELVR